MCGDVLFICLFTSSLAFLTAHDHVPYDAGFKVEGDL